MRRNATRNPENFRKPKRFERTASHYDMRVVDWVERPAQDADGTGIRALLRAGS